MDNFNQYDIVRIVRLNRPFALKECLPGKRTPKVGDKATIIEIYTNPTLGYELESTNQAGETEWLVSIRSSDLVMELIPKSTK